MKFSKPVILNELLFVLKYRIFAIKLSVVSRVRKNRNYIQFYQTWLSNNRKGKMTWRIVAFMEKLKEMRNKEEL